ncbi:MAG: signal peptidase I [Nitrosarchaeum sp.]
MKKKSISKGILKDILIVAIGVIAIWIGLQIAFGTQNPFYVVASGSMIPVLEVYDVLIVQGHEPFEDIKVGDIIVFNRPVGHDRVIVHRVASIIDDDPKTIRTKGDANPSSIPGTDFPITKEEYIGKVAYVIPQVGYVTQLLKPPINYVIIVVVVGIMIAKQMYKKKDEKTSLQDPVNQNDMDIESSTKIQELDKIERDNEYSKHEEGKFSETEESKNTEKDQK